MSSNYWAKLWIEMVDDRKTATLPDSSWRRFVECILLAKELDEGGYLPLIEDMAFRLRLNQTALDDDLTRLALAGLVERRENDRWFVTNFEKRQAKMEPAERTARHRDATRKKRYGNDSVTDRYTEKRREEKNTETDEDAPLDVGGPGAESSSPFFALQQHFTQQTAIVPNEQTGTYDRDWRQPLEAILSQTNGNTSAAIAAIDAALNVARGHNERGKTYTVASPRSISGMAVNHINASNGQATVGEDDNLWQRALRAIAQRDYSDGRLKAAISAVGFDRITHAGDKEVMQLKRSLGDEYRRIPATA